MQKRCNYNYLVVDISGGEGEAYKAYIPKFKDIHVMADTPEELHEEVIFTLNMAVKKLKKDGRPVPPPDNQTKFSGKVLIRINSELHEKLFLEAQANGKSLNKYIETKLS